MDKWAVETVFGSGESKRRWQTKAKYRAYAQSLVNTKIPELTNLHTLRERDKVAMKLAMSKG